MLGGHLGLLLYGDVSVMFAKGGNLFAKFVTSTTEVLDYQDFTVGNIIRRITVAS